MSTYLTRASHVHARAREALRRAGHTSSYRYTTDLVYAVEVETGRACTGDHTEFIRAWLDSLPVPAPRTPPTFRALTIEPLSMMRHNLDRAALAEPKMQATAGRAGNGSENSPVWRR